MTNKPDTEMEACLALLPCPFCGDAPKHTAVDYEVSCWHCGISISAAIHDDDYIAAWNRRTPAVPTDVGALIGDLWKRRHELTQADLLEAAPVVIGIAAGQYASLTALAEERDRLLASDRRMREALRGLLPDFTGGLDPYEPIAVRAARLALETPATDEGEGA